MSGSGIDLGSIYQAVLGIPADGRALRDEVRAFREEMRARFDLVEARIDFNGGDNRALGRRIDDLLVEVKLTQRDVAALKQEFAALKQEVAGLQREVRLYHDGIVAQGAGLAELEKRVIRLERAQEGAH